MTRFEMNEIAFFFRPLSCTSIPAAGCANVALSTAAPLSTPSGYGDPARLDGGSPAHGWILGRFGKERKSGVAKVTMPALCGSSTVPLARPTIRSGWYDHDLRRIRDRGGAGSGRHDRAGDRPRPGGIGGSRGDEAPRPRWET